MNMNDNNAIDITEEQIDGLINWITDKGINQHNTFDYLIRDLTGNFNDELTTKEQILANYLHTYYEMTIQMCAKLTAGKYGYRTYDETKINEYNQHMNETFQEYKQLSDKENKKHNYIYDVKPASKMN